MTFEEILDQAITMLQRRGRLTYGALKRQFQLDDAYLEDVKAELIEGQRLAVDEDGRVLVWTGGARMLPASVASPFLCRRTPFPLRTRRLSPQPPSRCRTRNGASSPCSFVTWWTRRHSPANSTQKSCVRWCGPIKTPAPRWSPALRGISRSIWAMASSSTLAIPWHTKTTPSGPSGPDLG